MCAIVISDDGKLIFTGSYEKTVRWRDARNGKAIGKPMERSSWVDHLAIRTDGDVIVSGYRDFSILQWDAESDEKIGDHIIAAGYIENLVISNNGAIITCRSSYYNFVKQWNIKTGEPLCEPMKWSEEQYVLDEMRRARLCGEQE